MNIYRVHCTVPPPFSKLQWQRWPPLVPRRSFYPPFSALSHPLSSALFAPLLLALRMALFLLHLLTRFASSPSWFCAQPPFVSPVCAPVSLFLSPAFFPSFPSLFSSLVLFVFDPPSPRLPFSCASVRPPSRIWAIFPKKRGAVCNGWANDVWCGKGSHWRALRSGQALCEARLSGTKYACQKRHERATFLLHSALYLEKTRNS